MIPAAFEYHAPKTLEEALRLVERHGDEAKLLAGGHSLLPLMKLRLAAPRYVIDIGHLRGMSYIREENGQIAIGALTTHAEIEQSALLASTCPLLPETAAQIGDVQVRNRGTIGGSLSHADPSADWMTSLAAIGAEVLIRGAGGQRRLAIEDFVTGAFEVALDADEILEAVRIPRLSRSARWGYYKICRKTGEFAQAIAAVLHDPQRSVFRAVIGATESRPIVFTNAASLFSGEPRAGLPTAFDAGAVAHALSAAGVTDPFDNQIHVVALKRAVDRAHLA